MFFKKWKEKKEKEIKDKEITDRLNELISQYRRECIWYMIKSEMSEEEVQKQDVSADHLMESALREAKTLRILCLCGFHAPAVTDF